jgi:hypothetical protein
MKRVHPINLLITASLLFFSATHFMACNKAGNSPAQSSTDSTALNISASADNEADIVYNDVATNVMGVNADCGLGTGIGIFVAGSNNIAPWMPGWEHCFVATIELEAIGIFPKTVTLDFGDGCTGPDGHIRKGKIITVYTDPLYLAGSTATTTFDKFYFDTLHVEGAHTITNNSTADNRIFTTTIQGGKITRPAGGYIVWNRTHIWTQTEGNSTPYFPLDDIFSITGTSSGTTYLAGITIQWTTNITESLIHKFLCPWIVSGQVQIETSNVKSTLNFGSGACDNKATLNVNGNIFEIIL